MEGKRKQGKGSRVSSKATSSATSTSFGDSGEDLILEDSDVSKESTYDSDDAEGVWHEDLGYDNLSQYELRAKIADLLQQVPEAYLDKRAINILPDLASMERKGWVMKTTASCWTAWAWRWLVLQDNQLRWYEDEEELLCRGCIDFELIEVEAVRLWELPYRDRMAHRARTGGCCGRASIGECILGTTKRAKFHVYSRVSAGTRAFEFGMAHQEEADAWVTAIEAHIDAAVKTTKNLNDGDGPRPAQQDDDAASDAKSSSTTKTEPFHPLLMKDFALGQRWWKVERITPHKFESVAQTGDVLLFRSEGVYPKLFRSQTGGRFDHVALVVRLDGNNLAIVEACGADPVNLCTWKNFVNFRWFALYRQICLRRVRCDRSDGRLSKLQDWLQGAMGKPFDPKAAKARGNNKTSTPPVATKSDNAATADGDAGKGAGDQGAMISLAVPLAGKAPPRSHNMGPDDHHICARFVAEALKRLGVLAPSKSTSHVNAGHFSAKKMPMVCNKGCRLDSEDLIIDFSHTPGATTIIGGGARKSTLSFWAETISANQVPLADGGKRWSLASDAFSRSSASPSSPASPE